MATALISDSLVQRDRSCIWHPFTQMQTAQPPIPIVKGKGLYLYGEDGRQYLDAISSWWVNLHGHAHPYIIDKIKAQADLLEHVFSLTSHMLQQLIWDLGYFRSFLGKCQRFFIRITGQQLLK